MSVKANVEDLLQKMATGQMMEGFEQYYADDVEVVEANGDSFKGKDTQRKRIIEWMSGVVEFHDGGTSSWAVNEESGTAFIESWTDATFQGGRMKFEEVAVQTWKDGKIVHERFYYDMPTG